MEITYEKGNLIDLIEKLDNDLNNIHDISRLGRIPEPRPGMRYREILLGMFRESGFISATVFIDFKNGIRRVYTFMGKVIPRGDINNLFEMPIYTEGYYIDKKGDEIINMVIYNPYTFKNSYELFKMISEFGERYRLTDYEVYVDRMIEYLKIEDLLSGDVGG
ncbi:TPA: hypothetical protein EYP83_04175 [Candidatus Geothermarchaeota archaeon]|nr:hypothetical protein [Candidatus Geothermarchaeota archaeon]